MAEPNKPGAVDSTFDKIDQYRTLIISLGSILGGVLLLVFGYFWEDSHKFASFLLEQIGALCIFGAGYSAISDYSVRKNFEAQVRDSINTAGLDKSIKDLGLARAIRNWDAGELSSKIEASSSVLMLVIRSNSYFGGSYGELRLRMQNGDLNLTVLLPNPLNRHLMALMSAKFSDANTPQKLANSILDVVNVWLREQIYRQLPEHCRSRLEVRLIDKYPLYSAYQFDQGEMWYIPYHFRDNAQQIPTFVFGSDFKNSEVYKDVQALHLESQLLDLSKLLVIPDGYFEAVTVPATPGV